MTTRLRKLLRIISCCLGLLLSLTDFSRLNAQSSFFTFSYNGPDSLSVGSNCTRSLQGSIPNPVVTSTIGATITTSVFDATASGFPFNQAFVGGETAHVFWLVEDNMMHAFTFEFFVFFVDNAPPMFNLTGINDTLYFNSVVQVTDPPIIVIMDNCTGFTQSFVETQRPDTCDAGVFTRTWLATDQAGNATSFVQTVIIAADVTPPTITFPPQNGGAPCEMLATAYPAWLLAQMTAFTAQDPSGIKSLTNNAPAVFPPGCKVPLTVTFKATDNCNLMIPTTAVFATMDNQGPVVSSAPKDTIAYCSPTGGHLAKLGNWVHTHAYAQATDACSEPLSYTMTLNGVSADSAAVVAAFNASFSGNCGTQNIGGQPIDKVSAFVRVDFFVQDACGNQTFAGGATFAAVDTLPPVITGSNTTEQCGGDNDQNILQNWINAKGNATIADDCSSASWTNFAFVTSEGQAGTGTFNTGPYPSVAANNCTWYVDVNFRAADECGNNSAKTLRFQIVDTQSPVFTGLAPNITVYCPNPLPTVPAATITDNCDSNTAITFSRLYQDSICDGSYTVLTTWKATDDCGNTATITQQIFVRDTTRPVFTLVPDGLLIRCDTFVLPPAPQQGVNIQATDLCSPVLSITTATASFQQANPALCGHYSYNLVRTFTATDQCGNTQTRTQLISVIDNLPPVPGGVLDTTALCSAMVPFPAPAPTALDACSGQTNPPVYVNTDSLPGSCVGAYTLKIHWIAQDVCGNQAQFEQVVHVVDTVAPTLANIPPPITVECENIPEVPVFATFNGQDNCSSNVVITFQESEIRNPSLSSCEHWANYTVRRQWTAKDACGNARTYTQDIQIEDTTPPVIVPPPTITLASDVDACGVVMAVPAPLSVFDGCTAGSKVVLLKDTMPVTAPPGPITSTPVDTMVFKFLTPNLPPTQPALTNVSLAVFLDRVDAEGPTEFFKIFGEKGVFLGNTTPSPSQCSSSPSTTILSLTADQFNEWTRDGMLTITLAPNALGGNAINPVCPNSQVRVHIGYTYASPDVAVTISYSLDGGVAVPFSPLDSIALSIGTHTLVYTVADCSGNSSSASVEMVVEDSQPPQITAPAPMTAYVPAGTCSANVTLPFPVIAENCEMSGHIAHASAAQMLTFTNDPDAGIVPANTVMSIPGLIPNAIANGVLQIKFKGDNAGPKEYFNIFQNNTQIAATDLGSITGQCQDTVITNIAVTAAQINAWASTGTAVFRAEANTDAGPSFDFDFINPCSLPLLPDQTDGVSRIQAMLEYSYAIVSFKIIRNPSTVVATGALQGSQTLVNLLPGSYTIEYTTTDNAGLIGSTTFPLIVRDTVKPTARCKPSLIIRVNPSGVNDYILQSSEINNNSTDNCAGTNLTFVLSKTTFSCNQAGNNFPITMLVKDTSGNSATCTTILSVQNEPPIPTYNNPVCEGDTLQLFANPPVPGAFSYAWSGPMFMTTVKDPTILNAQPSLQGLYTVKVTGATGCTATGTVTVNFASLSVPAITVSSGGNFCQGQNIVLGTQTYPGQGVAYQWYADALPNPILLGSTNLPIFSIAQPAPGVYHYFVKVRVGDCLTPNSIVITVNVFARPPATVDDDKIIVCEGQPLAFGTSVSGSGLTYAWSGPGWAPSTAQFPLVSSAATQAQAGFHTLTTYQNGCASMPTATVEVVVKHTPPQPQITGDTEKCVGEDLPLTAVVSGLVGSYQWENPLLDVFVTNNNTFTIAAVTTADCGNWRVRANFENCFSPWSDLVFLCPQAYPVLNASSNSPVCQDSLLNLMATASMTGLSWCWTLPDSSQIFQQNPTVTSGQTGDFTVVGKTSFGCADTVIIPVIASVAPVIDSIVVNAPTCSDGVSDGALIPYFSGVNLPFTYSWKRNGTDVSSQLTLSFPDVTPAANGPYTFVVKDKYGCPSLPVTATIDVQAAVATPILSILPNPVCAGQSVVLTLNNPGDYNANSQYHWIDPEGITTITVGPQLLLSNVAETQGGDYYVFVSQGACYSAHSNTVSLVVNAVPPTPIPVSNQPICVGTTLQLDVEATPGASYTWIGPSGFSSNVKNPERSNAVLPAHEGIYSVMVVVNGCASAFGEVMVDIMDLPKLPIITPASPSPVCLDQPITAFLSVSLSSQTFGARYTWRNEETGDTLFGPASSAVLNLVDLPDSLLVSGWHSFQVSAWKQGNPNGQGCSTDFSNAVSVRFDTIPDNFAKTAEDHPACAAQSIELSAINPTGNVSGHWQQVAGPPVIIFNPDAAVASFNGVAGNVYAFTWSLTSGGCKNFSVDTLTITAEAPEKAFAGNDIFICSGANVSLNGTQGLSSSGTWSQMGQIGVTIADPTEPTTPITGLNAGNRYLFVWTLDNIGCPTAADTVSVYFYSVKPNITGNQFVCTGEDCTILNTLGLQSWEFGSWESKSGNLVFTPPNNPSTTVCGLVPGPNEVYWTINNNACPGQARDTFTVNYEIFPQANADNFEVAFGDTVHFQVLSNDILPTDPPEVTIIVPPTNGTIIANSANGQYVYRPNSGFSGVDMLVYRICNIRCGPAACSAAVVTFEVGEAGDCYIPTIITPNADGRNDTFKLPPECYYVGEGEDAIELTIFNQWGDYVYHKNPFVRDADAWDGADLPAGTYYYVIKFEGSGSAKAGFILLQR